MDQTPGTDEEIHSFCTGRFGITFPQFSKFVVDRDGSIAGRFEPTDSMDKLKAKVEELL